MRTEKVFIYNLTKMEFKNKETGEVTERTKISYLRPVSEGTDNVMGLRPLVSYAPGEAYENLQKFLVRPNVTVQLSEKDTDTGIKLVLAQVENVKIR